MEIINSRASLISSIQQYSTTNKSMINTPSRSQLIACNRNGVNNADNVSDAYKDTVGHMVSWIRNNMKDFTIFDYGFKTITLHFCLSNKTIYDSNNMYHSYSQPRLYNYNAFYYIITGLPYTRNTTDQFLDFFNITDPNAHVLGLMTYYNDGNNCRLLGPTTCQAMRRQDKFNEYVFGTENFSCYENADAIANHTLQTSLTSFINNHILSKGIVVHRESERLYKLMR
jgi:hypothetical protein